MSASSIESPQRFGAFMTRPGLLLIPIGLWAAALWLFVTTDRSSSAVPPIAAGGVAEVLGFYLPLMIFTVVAVFLFTWKRDRPRWEGYAIDRASAGREVLLVLGYVLLAQLVLGGLLGIGLHFPGPALFDASVHGLAEVLVWVVAQSVAFIVVPMLWLRRRGFSVRRALAGISFKRDWWIMVLFWCGDFFGVVAISDFGSVPPSDYATAIPFSILVNGLGAGLPVLIMIHLIIIPRLSVLFENQLLVVLLGGLAYASFSLFDPGVVYGDTTSALGTLAFILASQTLIGMGKAVFTVRTGNPIIHFTSYHILGARVAFDTGMYARILGG